MTSPSSPGTAVVTGATSGIGAAIARTLADRGFAVVAGGRDADRGAAVVAEIRAAGGSAVFVPVDLAGGYAELRAFAAAAGPVDVLVNNAGIYPATTTDALPDADLDAMLAVNVRAPHVLTAALAPAMADRGHGVIVNVGSWMASVGSPYAAFYTATKAAVQQLTRAWAAEYGPRGVRVNTVAPGVTATPGNADAADVLKQIAATTPAGVPVEPQDVADAVAFLASDAARMIHGALLAVDGGILAAKLG